MREALAALYRANRLAFVAAIVLSAAAAASGTLIVDLIRRCAISENPGAFTVALSASIVLRLALVLSASVTLHLLVAANVTRVRTTLAASVGAMQLEKTERIGDGRILSALTEDAGVLSESARAFVKLSVNALTLVAVCAYILWLGPAIGAVAFGFVGAAFVLIRWLERTGGTKMGEILRARAKMIGQVQKLVAGAAELRQNAHRRHSFLTRDLFPSIRDVHTRVRQYVLRYEVGSRATIVMFLLLLGGVIFVGPTWFNLEQGRSAAIAMALFLAMAPLEGLMTELEQVATASYVEADLRELGLYSDEHGQPRSAISSAPYSGPLELRDVRFTYAGDGERSFELGPIDLRLEPGRLVFLTGSNGSGKSTLARIIAGLYQPHGGHLMVGSNAITNPDAHREMVSAVFTEFYVFERLYGLAPDPRRAQQWLARLDLDTKVTITDGRLSTTALSSGQRKRLAYLIAMLEDRPVVVLDEWAAEQHPEFRRTFYRELLPELRQRGKIVVVISHDDTYFDLADEIVSMHDGKIVSITSRGGDEAQRLAT